MRPHSARSILLGLAILGVVTGACKKKTTDGTVSDTSAMLPPVVAVTVADVDLGRALGPDKRVVAEVDNFGTRDTVFAAVATNGSGAATLTARWTFEDGQVVDETSQSISPTGPAMTEFHVSKPTAWPTGKYKLVILLNGTEVDSKDFEVK